MPENEKGPAPLMTRFFHACLLALAAVVALYLALQILATIWIWLVLIASVIGLIAAAMWYVRWRRDRRW